VAATPTKFTEAYDKIWTVLEDDANYVAFIGEGRKFKFSSLADIGIDLRPVDCPATIIRPDLGNITLPNNAQQEFLFPVEFTLAINKDEWAYIVEFFCRVYGPLMDSVYLNLGLSYIKGWEFSRLKLRQGEFKEDTPSAAWLAEFTLTLHIFCDGRNDALFTIDS